MRLFFTSLCLSFSLFTTTTLQAQTLNQEQVEKIVHDYLLKNPEILRDMANALEEKDKLAADQSRGQTLAASAKDIFRNAQDAVIGNPDGDVTIVEFMDYNCGWCRKAMKEIQGVLATDKNVRVVMKEFPIFGEGSEYAAKAAMASVRQGKYWALHQALFSTSGQITAAVVDKVATEVGLDVALLKRDMEAPEIAANMAKTQALAASLQFTGTPGFMVGNKVFPGFEAQDKLLAAVAEIRANGGCKVC